MEKLQEWRRTLKGLTALLVVAAIVETARQWLGFASEKITRFDTLVWLCIFAGLQAGILLVDCAEPILLELNHIRLQRGREVPSHPLLEAKERLDAEERESKVRVLLDSLRKSKEGQKPESPSDQV